ncbi:MAG: hypothetical protein L0177_19040, partial [Chloroflexi bacterium]|nr:hypothetical protein [Chloroflexota bacterium]
MNDDVVYSGKTKLEFCERLGLDWQRLADYLDIPQSDQGRFAQGEEPRAIWDWLYRRRELA